jgi:hypothetical protein
MALRIKLAHEQEKRPPTLRPLMDEAIRKGLLHDEHVEHHRRLKDRQAERRQLEEEMASEFGWPPPMASPVADPQAYCKLLAETFPKLRNHYAHGSSSLTFTVVLTFSMCRDLIDQLFVP